MVLYILSQISVAIALIIDLISKVFRQKKYLLIFISISNIFFIISYALLKSPLPAIANVLYIFRGIAYLNFDEKQKPYIYYLITTIILTSIFIPFLIIFWSSTIDLCMLISTIFILFVLSLKNTLYIRIGLMLNCALWVIYDVSLLAYVNVACDVLSIIIVATALVRYNIIEPKKKAQTVNESENNNQVKAST